MSSSSRDFSGIVSKLGLQPMEAPSMVSNKKAKLYIGIPKERSFQEHRIAITPESVRVLTANGHRIVIEENAGKESRFYDNDYSEAGAEIVADEEAVYKADIILKVAPPLPYEIALMKMNQTLISPLHIPSIKQEYIEMLMKKRITALAYEYTKDDAGFFPFVRSMSEIAGSTVVLIAGEFLSNANNGKGILLGGVSGVPPAKVVILGAGVVGTFAARAIIGLGATVSVFDNNVYKLMRLQERIGARVFTSTVQPEILANELETADVAIGALHSKKGRTPILVTEQMVERMKPGAVVIDVSIDQGGCFETSELTSHLEPTFKKHGVIHYCVPNITSRVSRTASYAFSNILTPILLRMGDLKGMQGLIYEDVGIRNGIYLYKGNLTNEHLAKIFQIKHSNLELLFASNL
ncbi:MAG: alanine dehydrogenase [Chitinophagales bacterium]|nr:alanine dehydrogenase [Chitinophagales bacterium]OJV29876.1 MAG: alanine dehydrogenase [Bacteroidetes bacterium 37-13]HRP39025.1 alanine dehydrogenase [Chitinophagales bacterium]